MESPRTRRRYQYAKTAEERRHRRLLGFVIALPALAVGIGAGAIAYFALDVTSSNGLAAVVVAAVVIVGVIVEWRDGSRPNQL